MQSGANDEITKRLLAARWAIAAVFLIDGAYVGSVLSYLPQIKAGLHLSDDVLGRCLFFSPTGALLTIPRVGGLIGRFGSKVLILVSGGALSVVIPLAVAAPSVWLFCGGLLLFGMFNGLLDAAMNAQSVSIQHRYPRPMLSSTHGCWSLGGFAAAGGVALGTRLGHDPAVHTAVVCGALLLALVASWSKLLPHSDDDTGAEPSFAWPKGALVWIGILLMCAFAAEGAAYDWTAVYVHSSLKTTQEVAALAFGIYAAAMSGGRLSGDFVVHRLGVARTLQLGSVLSAGGMLLAVASSSVALTLLGFCLCALGMANVVPILFRAAGSVPGVSTGTGVAAVTACGYAAFLMSPPAIGFIAVRQSLSFALGLAGGLILAVGIWGPSALALTRLRSE